MTKLEKAVQEMLSEHKELFDEFKKLHDGYKTDPDAVKLEFNRVGSQVLELIRKYENKLCGSTERSDAYPGT